MLGQVLSCAPAVTTLWETSLDQGVANVSVKYQVRSIIGFVVDTVSRLAT